MESCIELYMLAETLTPIRVICSSTIPSDSAQKSRSPAAAAPRIDHWRRVRLAQRKAKPARLTLWQVEGAWIYGSGSDVSSGT